MFETICTNGIIIINTVIRLIIVAIMTKVGYKTESAQAFYITLSVFISQFMNTGVLILISQANLKPQHIPILSAIFDSGYYTDYTTEWYILTGDIIIETMMFNAVFPTIM